MRIVRKRRMIAGTDLRGLENGGSKAAFPETQPERELVTPRTREEHFPPQVVHPDDISVETAAEYDVVFKHPEMPRKTLAAQKPEHADGLAERYPVICITAPRLLTGIVAERMAETGPGLSSRLSGEYLLIEFRTGDSDVRIDPERPLIFRKGLVRVEFRPAGKSRGGRRKGAVEFPQLPDAVGRGGLLAGADKTDEIETSVHRPRLQKSVITTCYASIYRCLSHFIQPQIPCPVSAKLAKFPDIGYICQIVNKVLVILVTFNGMRWIDRCLQSIEESEEPLDVFVVDNGSTDGTVARIRETAAGWFVKTDRDGRGTWLVDLVEREDNPGFGKANNLGLAFALERGYKYVYLLNQDAWIYPDTIGKLLEAFSKDRKRKIFGVLSPLQTGASGNRLDPRFEAKCGKYLSLNSTGTKVISLHPEETVAVPFVMAAHWMIRRECLEAVGGFSPAFHQYGEDDNWLHRASKAGFAAGIVPSAKAVHDREMRPESTEKKMQLKCISTVVKVSDPGALLLWRLIREPLELLAMSVIHRSTIPLRFIPTLVSRYPELVRLRHASVKPGAFLDRVQ